MTTKEIRDLAIEATQKSNHTLQPDYYKVAEKCAKIMMDKKMDDDDSIVFMHTVRTMYLFDAGMRFIATGLNYRTWINARTK